MSGIGEEMPNEPGTTTGSPTPLANENSNRNGSDTNLTTNQNRRTYNHNRKTNTTGFKGETERMNSNVFQLHSERKNKSQFPDTMEALRVYCSTAYKSDIEYLNSLFTELKEPSVTYRWTQSPSNQ